ncbi:uncharacterized protein LOC108099613 [Drosophila ficusphila]|uniref:uncharacterized protein LOC108099613 n=1 Tax=Drosophila ficusphila TaxID=30025 RepID=UPI0007E8A169|nr:uncharacterized protein LOC108099613 [Drosophila ficusphila]
MNSSIVTESDAALKASQLQNPKGDSGPGFVRLKTKQKKLLKKALLGGLTREKALKMVQAIPVVKGLLPAPYKINELVNQTNSVVKPVRLGISSESAGTPLTSNQMSSIKEAIIDVTVEQSGNLKPQFEGCAARKGWLLVICSNLLTAEWLKRNFSHVRTKAGLKLRLMGEEELPRKNVVQGYFPDSLSTSSKKVLDIIEAQNPVSTSEWRVMNRLTHGDLLHLVLTVDNESHKKLVDLDGIISFRFGRLKLSMREPLNKRKSLLNAKEGTTSISQSTETRWPNPAVVPDRQRTVVGNDGPWNYINSWNSFENPWNICNSPWNHWDQQHNFRYGSTDPRQCPRGSLSVEDCWVRATPPWLGNN